MLNSWSFLSNCVELGYFISNSKYSQQPNKTASLHVLSFQAHFGDLPQPGLFGLGPCGGAGATLPWTAPVRGQRPPFSNPHPQSKTAPPSPLLEDRILTPAKLGQLRALRASQGSAQKVLRKTEKAPAPLDMPVEPYGRPRVFLSPAFLAKNKHLC